MARKKNNKKNLKGSVRLSEANAAHEGTPDPAVNTQQDESSLSKQTSSTRQIEQIESPQTSLKNLAAKAPAGTAHVVAVGDLRFPLVDTRKHIRRTFYVPHDKIITDVIRLKADNLFSAFLDDWSHQQFRVAKWWSSTSKDDQDDLEGIVKRAIDLCFQAVYPFLAGDRQLFTGVFPELDPEYLVLGRSFELPAGVLPLCRAASAQNFEDRYSGSVPPGDSYTRFALFIRNAQLGIESVDGDTSPREGTKQVTLPDIEIERDFLFQLRRVGIYVTLSSIVKESAVFAVTGRLSDEWIAKFQELRQENLSTLHEWKSSTDYAAFEDWRGCLTYDHLANLSCQAIDEVFAIISRTPQGIQFQSVAELARFAPQIGLDALDPGDDHTLQGATNIAIVLEYIEHPEQDLTPSDLYESFAGVFDRAAEVYQAPALPDLLPQIRQQLLCLYALTFINLTYDAVKSHKAVQGSPGNCILL